MVLIVMPGMLILLLFSYLYIIYLIAFNDSRNNKNDGRTKKENLVLIAGASGNEILLVRKSFLVARDRKGAGVAKKR
jgi:hypothetical protein